MGGGAGGVRWRGRRRAPPGLLMARLDPRRSCGKDAGVRGSSGSPVAEKSGGELAYRRRGDSAPLGARRGDALGLRAARGVDGVQGGSQGGLKGGAPVISGFGLGRKPARISGGRRGRCAGERCGDDGSDPWGRPVSGTQRRGRGRASAGVGGWQLGPGRQRNGARAVRAAARAGAARAGRWAGVRERGAETGRCELDRRGSADARGRPGSGLGRGSGRARWASRDWAAHGVCWAERGRERGPGLS